VLGFIATLILVGTLILAGGSYFYGEYAKKGLEEQKRALESERSRINEADITRLRELNQRIDAAFFLLNRHLSPSKIFDALELSTKEPVQFSAFTYERRDSGNVTLTLAGATEAFQIVSLQALQFGRDAVLKNSAVTALAEGSVDTSGDTKKVENSTSDVPKVSFSILADVAAANIGYDGRNFINEPAVVDEQATDGTTANGTADGFEFETQSDTGAAQPNDALDAGDIIE
jgi:voltage-gated potassium channel Kch